MRLTHLTTALMLTMLFGCNANATLSAGAPDAPASASPTAAPTASPEPVGSQSPSSECLAAFDKYNTDKDTFLSHDEYVAGKWSELRFVKAPTAEEEAATKKGFREEAERADQNDDGKLTREEYAATCT